MEMTITSSPFYRVTAKAIIFDEHDRILVLKNDRGGYELPGGGWEHDETIEQCIERELQEELQIGAESIGTIIFMYRGKNLRHGYAALRLVVPVKLQPGKLVPSDGMLEVRYVTKQEFMALDLMQFEGSVQENVDKIWTKKEDD